MRYTQVMFRKKIFPSPGSYKFVVGLIATTTVWRSSYTIARPSRFDRDDKRNYEEF